MTKAGNNNSNNIEVSTSNKSILPTTDNVLNLYAENYEDWDEELCNYEQRITSIFKLKLSKKQITKKELANTFISFYKIAITNAKMENCYRTAKMLHNLYPLHNSPQPIILPSNFAV